VTERRFEQLKRHPALRVQPTAQGVTYKYYEGVFQSADDLKRATPQTEAVQSDFSLTMNKVRPNFGVAFGTFLDAPEDGVYTFGVKSDDGSKMYVDGELVVNNDGPHGPDLVKGEIFLGKGFHKIDLEYFQQGGGYSLDVLWKTPKTKALRPIDAFQLYR